MIKLKSLLPEVKKLDLTKKEDAAEWMIRQVWKQMPYGEDKFSDHDFFLWLDNDADLTNKRNQLAKKLFPDDEEESSIKKFDDIISQIIEQLESKKIKRSASKVNQLDPLFILKKIVRGKTWEGAKQTLFKNTLGSWFYKGGRISDEDVETAFNRMYKNAMGETIYDITKEKLYGRLSNIHRQQVDRSKSTYDHEESNKYVINLFIDLYVGYGANKFPDKVKVYRGVNNPTVPIRPGDFVTLDKDYAKSYARGDYGTIVNDTLDSKDLYVYRIEPHGTELVYWPEGHQIKKFEGHTPTFKEFWTQINQL
jgi:hypothetical protein